MPRHQVAELEDILEGNSFFLKQALGKIASASDDKTLEDACFEATVQYRLVACCVLLCKADRRQFAGLLQKSGLLWLHFLGLAERRHSVRPEYKYGSMGLPFVAALVGGDIDTATALASKASAQHLRDLEYEDDFLRYRFIQQLTLKIYHAVPVDLESILGHWSEVLEGGDDAYFNACQALLKQDEASWEKSIDELIQVRQQGVEAWEQDFSFEPRLKVPESFLFLNGLALLNLAERMGLPLRAEYPLMPSLARIPPGFLRLSNDSWRTPLEGIR